MSALSIVVLVFMGVIYGGGGMLAVGLSLFRRDEKPITAEEFDYERERRRYGSIMAGLMGREWTARREDGTL